MNWTLDIIVALIIGLTVFFAAKNGFVKTAISALSLVVAIIVTSLFAQPVADFLADTAIADSIREATEEQITTLLLEEGKSVNSLLNGESEEFNTLTTIAGIDTQELKAWYGEHIVDEVSAESLLAKRISEPIIDLISMLLAIIILFFGTQIVMSVLSVVLDKVARLPILRSCNKLLGVILGVILALVRVCLFCFVVEILIENSAFLGSEFLSNLDPDKTLIYKIFRDIDIFSFML